MSKAKWVGRVHWEEDFGFCWVIRRRGTTADFQSTAFYATRRTAKHGLLRMVKALRIKVEIEE